MLKGVNFSIVLKVINGGTVCFKSDSSAPPAQYISVFALTHFIFVHIKN